MSAYAVLVAGVIVLYGYLIWDYNRQFPSRLIALLEYDFENRVPEMYSWR